MLSLNGFTSYLFGFTKNVLIIKWNVNVKFRESYDLFGFTSYFSMICYVIK